jgi:hypothetical protein
MASLAFGACIGLVVGLIWTKIDLFGDNGVIHGVNGLLQALVGFFIAALAAIATFQGTTYRIDERLDGDAALLVGEPLTRRQLLSHMFAYLSCGALFLFIVGIAALAIAPTIQPVFDEFVVLSLRTIFAIVFFSALAHLIGTTMIGMVFLGNRLTRVPEKNRFTIQAKDNPAKDNSSSLTNGNH